VKVLQRICNIFKFCTFDLYNTILFFYLLRGEENDDAVTSSSYLVNEKVVEST
jgi:hypothetical protein